MTAPAVADPRLAGDLRAGIKVFPDFPRPGIQFQDLTPVFGCPALVRRLAEAFTAAYAGAFDRVLAVEARGFILGTAVAAAGDRPLVLARKAGKLPGPVDRVEYELEYGKAVLEVQHGALGSGDRVLVVDDLLATGGTLAAAGELVVRAGGEIAGYAVAVTLEGLGGAARLAPGRICSILSIDVDE